MGRTNPTFRGVLQSIEERWQAYRRALRHGDKEYFDDLFEYARAHADAAGYLNRESPLLPVLFSMSLGQEKRRQELEARVADLEARVATLEADEPTDGERAGEQSAPTDRS
ncbi:hypothetical protein ACFR9U_20875 [Halorientalis brevis]|uniref:DUF8156 domain-containing protein n=1 Tax=Halorientalis brevis TaxID=1126241 RepID=A0ABD6CJJ4_9EURY|nr:hypothetical protein [Halorientalis brevis]